MNLKYVKNLHYLLSCNATHERIQAKGCIILQLYSEDFEFVSDHRVTKEILNIIKEVLKRFVD